MTTSPERHYATRVETDAVAKKLTELLPLVDVDWGVLAGEVIESVNLTAVETIMHREAALQATLVSVMDYYNGVMNSLREQVAKAQLERERLTLRLAKKTEPSPSL